MPTAQPLPPPPPRVLYVGVMFRPTFPATGGAGMLNILSHMKGIHAKHSEPHEGHPCSRFPAAGGADMLNIPSHMRG